VGPRVSLKVAAKRKKSCPSREFDLGLPTPSMSLYRLSCSGSWTPFIKALKALNISILDVCLFNISTFCICGDVNGSVR
jgi:hypothetical protein